MALQVAKFIKHPRQYGHPVDWAVLMLLKYGKLTKSTQKFKRLFS